MILEYGNNAKLKRTDDKQPYGAIEDNFIKIVQRLFHIQIIEIFVVRKRIIVY